MFFPFFLPADFDGSVRPKNKIHNSNPTGFSGSTKDRLCDFNKYIDPTSQGRIPEKRAEQQCVTRRSVRGGESVNEPLIHRRALWIRERRPDALSASPLNKRWNSLPANHISLDSPALEDKHFFGGGGDSFSSPVLAFSFLSFASSEVTSIRL